MAWCWPPIIHEPLDSVCPANPTSARTEPAAFQAAGLLIKVSSSELIQKKLEGVPAVPARFSVSGQALAAQS